MPKVIVNIQKISNSGTYTGDSTANRAIPHGLGRIPKAVIINNNSSAFYNKISGYDGIQMVGSGVKTLTADTGTNFYVGNATGYVESANDNGVTYYWAAW